MTLNNSGVRQVKPLQINVSGRGHGYCHGYVRGGCLSSHHSSDYRGQDIRKSREYSPGCCRSCSARMLDIHHNQRRGRRQLHRSMVQHRGLHMDHQAEEGRTSTLIGTARQQVHLALQQFLRKGCHMSAVHNRSGNQQSQ